MRIEYFQLIDRIIDLNLNDLTIRVEANVPTDSTIFEGHFPGRPLMPGVLLIESMAQASGWLLIARTRFEKMPFLAALKEVKLRTFVTPGQALVGYGKDHARRLGLRADRGRDHRSTARPSATPTSRSAWSISRRANSAPACTRSRERIAFPMETVSLMADAKREPPRGLDHRHRHRVVSRRGAGRALAGARRTAIRRPTRATYPPYIIHKLAPLDFDKQIPKKGDQRQMEAWQRIGTYAAGLALDSAGIKGNAEILARTDMIVAAGGGERDIAADTAILSGLPGAEKPEAFLNERLMSDLRPTLFLAQLSNLLAGNISIVHGVTGSSRTFMGEESAGVDAVRIALSRIEAGQSDIALVGGSHNSERPDLLMLYEFGGFALKDKFAPVWQREASPGLALARARRIPGDRVPRACRGARRQTHRAAERRAVGSRQAQARRRHRGAQAAVGQDFRPPAARQGRGDLGRERRRARDRRGARLPRRAPGHCRPRHRHLSRSCLRAAVSDERGARRDRGQPW